MSTRVKSQHAMQPYTYVQHTSYQQVARALQVGPGVLQSPALPLVYTGHARLSVLQAVAAAAAVVWLGQPAW